MFEHSSDGILLLGDKGRIILRANPKACLLLGQEERGLIGKKLEEYLGRNLAEFELFTRAVINHGVAWTDTLSWPGGGHGPDLAVDVSASGYELDGGQYVLVTIHEMDRPIDDGPPPPMGMDKDAYVSERMKRFQKDVLNLTAHAVRTPLTPMLLQVAILERNLGPILTQENQKSLQIIRSNITRLEEQVASIISDATALNR